MQVDTKLLLFTLIIAHAVTTTVASVVRVSPDTGRLIDDAGREVTFHGVNYVIKTAPYLPDPATLRSNLELVQGLGLNAIRLGTLWTGLEPAPGVRNTTQLDALASIVETAATYGVHSLLDMHQDLYSQRFCGDGMPHWSIMSNASSFPSPLAAPYNVTGRYPAWEDCAKFGWALYYFTEAVSGAFGAFYNNTGGVLDRWATAWHDIAQRMAPLGDAVIGYELLNEPWPGDVFADPALIIPSLGDRTLLQAAWDKAAVAIRAADEDHAIFFEGITFDWVGQGFGHAPGGQEYANRSVLSYHYYVPPEISLAQTVDTSLATAQKLQCGAMLTEFFYSEDVMNYCDIKHQSWLMWGIEGFGDTKKSFGDLRRGGKGAGDPQPPSITALSRTYAPIVAGFTVLMKFDNYTRSFVLIYETNSARVRNSTTSIYLNEALHYPKGFSVRLLTSSDDPSAAAWTHSAKNTLTVVHDAVKLPNGTITVEIFAKDSMVQFSSSSAQRHRHPLN